MTVIRSKSLPEASRLPLLQKLLASLPSVSSSLVQCTLLLALMAIAACISPDSGLSGTTSYKGCAP